MVILFFPCQGSKEPTGQWIEKIGPAFETWFLQPGCCHCLMLPVPFKKPLQVLITRIPVVFIFVAKSVASIKKYPRSKQGTPQSPSILDTLAVARRHVLMTTLDNSILGVDHCGLPRSGRQRYGRPFQKKREGSMANVPLATRKTAHLPLYLTCVSFVSLVSRKNRPHASQAS